MLARKPVNNVIMKFMNLTCKLQWDNHLDLQLLRIQVLILQNWLMTLIKIYHMWAHGKMIVCG